MNELISENKLLGKALRETLLVRLKKDKYNVILIKNINSSRELYKRYINSYEEFNDLIISEYKYFCEIYNNFNDVKEYINYFFEPIYVNMYQLHGMVHIEDILSQILNLSSFYDILLKKQVNMNNIISFPIYLFLNINDVIKKHLLHSEIYHIPKYHKKAYIYINEDIEEYEIDYCLENMTNNIYEKCYNVILENFRNYYQKVFNTYNFYDKDGNILFHKNNEIKNCINNIMLSSYENVQKCLLTNVKVLENHNKYIFSKIKYKDNYTKNSYHKLHILQYLFDDINNKELNNEFLKIKLF